MTKKEEAQIKREEKLRAERERIFQMQSFEREAQEEFFSSSVFFDDENEKSFRKKRGKFCSGKYYVKPGLWA